MIILRIKGNLHYSPWLRTPLLELLFFSFMFSIEIFLNMKKKLNTKQINNICR